MDWFVIRHPETGGVGVVAETALLIHQAAGWLRVSEAIPDHEKAQIVAAHYADAPDLDAEPPAPAPAVAATKTEPTGAKAAAAETTKES